MGTCWNCETQVTLQDKETKCDKCHRVLFYKCNSCKEGFQIVNETTEEKLLECKLCGHFNCPHCSVCSYTCRRYEWERKILLQLLPEINPSKFPTLPTKIRSIIQFLIDERLGMDRKNCPERGVPITYAKTRIKSLWAKVEGFRVKNEKDREAFLARIKELTDIELGTELTVSASREAGSYGQEYRDAFNLLVCLGKFKVEHRKTKDDEDYDVFVRCEIGACKYLAKDSLIVNKCPKCETVYPRGIETCSNCSPYKKGKNKGQFVRLKEGLSNEDTCQCYRGQFIKNGWN